MSTLRGHFQQLGAAIEGHILEAFGTREHSTHGNNHDVQQLMFDLTRTARVFQSRKMVEKSVYHPPLERQIALASLASNLMR